MPYPALRIDRDLRSTRGLLVLGLGCNLKGPRGSPSETLAWTIRELATCFGPLAAAPVYRSAALDQQGRRLPEQPDYLNTVVIARRPDMDPEAALRFTRDLERRAGRSPLREIDAARPLDIDLLLWDTLSRQDADLVIPHPRMRQRLFVLRPLVDLVPLLTLPPDGASANELLARLGETQNIELVD